MTLPHSQQDTSSSAPRFSPYQSHREPNKKKHIAMATDTKNEGLFLAKMVLRILARTYLLTEVAVIRGGTQHRHSVFIPIRDNSTERMAPCPHHQAAFWRQRHHTRGDHPDTHHRTHPTTYQVRVASQRHRNIITDTERIKKIALLYIIVLRNKCTIEFNPTDRAAFTFTSYNIFSCHIDILIFFL